MNEEEEWRLETLLTFLKLVESWGRQPEARIPGSESPSSRVLMVLEEDVEEVRLRTPLAVLELVGPCEVNR